MQLYYVLKTKQHIVNANSSNIYYEVTKICTWFEGKLVSAFILFLQYLYFKIL